MNTCLTIRWSIPRVLAGERSYEGERRGVVHPAQSNSSYDHERVPVELMADWQIPAMISRTQQVKADSALAHSVSRTAA